MRYLNALEGLYDAFKWKIEKWRINMNKSILIKESLILLECVYV